MKMQSRITLGLVAAGFVAGAVIGVVLTFIGKIVAGAPPADLANHVWNAVAFGTIGAVVGPSLAWSALRRVPLWRAVAEPLLGGIADAIRLQSTFHAVRVAARETRGVPTPRTR